MPVPTTKFQADKHWLCYIAMGHFVDVMPAGFGIMPAFYPTGLHAHGLDSAALLGIGGVWLATLLWRLRRRTLVPMHDPRLQEVNAHG